MEGTPTKGSLPVTEGSLTPSKARPRASWYGVSMDSPPSEEHVEKMSVYGIFQVRWCKEVGGEGYQWFMYHNNGAYVATWDALVKLLGGRESCNLEEKSRTQPIWMIYGRRMGIFLELNTNFLTVKSDTPLRKRKKPQDKENSPPTDGDPPTGKDPVKKALVLHAPLALMVHGTSPDVPLQEVGILVPLQEEKFYECMRGYISHPGPYGQRDASLSSIVALIAAGRGFKIKHIDDIWITKPPNKVILNFAVTPGVNAIAVPIIELHRRVLALERLAAGLFQRIQTLVASPALDSIQGGDLVEMASLLTGLVPLGEGSIFWKIPTPEETAYPPRILMSRRGKSELGRCVEWMHDNRDNAFQRTYFIGHAEAWWFPVVCNVFTSCQKVDTRGPTIKANLERMVKIRANIILQERGYMLRYGGHMTQYCMVLADLLQKLASPPLPTYLQLVVLEEDGSYIRIKDDDRVLPIGNFEGQPLSKMDDVYTSVGLRVKEEKRVVQETCKNLKIQFPPPLATNLKAFFKAVQKAMVNDTHTRNATKHLAPSPSLPNATFDPAQWRK